MDTQTKWRGVRRSYAPSAAQTTPKLTRNSSFKTPERPTRTLNQAEECDVSASREAEDASSRWREMRQSVRTKATLETTKNDHGHAKIADLCPVDQEKVSKLVRRIVEIGTLHEEAEKEFQRQKEVLESEVKKLRQHVRRDSVAIEELSDKLRTTRQKAQLFEERVVVLEESIDSETRSRLKAEQTLDLLRLEVEKLRALVQQQQAEMQREANARQKGFDTELLSVKEELKRAQELLLAERNERLHDKQKALDQRLERSAAAGEEKLNQLHSLLVQQQYELQVKTNEQQEERLKKTKQQQKQIDAEMNQLKKDLKVAQEQLLQERENPKLENRRAIADTSESSTTVQGGPTKASSISPATSVPQALVFESRDQFTHLATDMQGDLAMFEEVKDLYAEDLFASRRWQAVPARFEEASWQGFNAAPTR